LDWQTVRSALRRHFGPKLDSADAHELDDLIQEGCVRLLRAARREPVEDLQGLITVIARRTFQDWLRRRYRNERLWKPLEASDELAIPPAVDPRFGDLVERIEFMVLEVFQREARPECEKLARGWFSRRSWKELADELGLSHAAVRKRWSRCLELPRRVLAANPVLRPLFGEEKDD
jgi:RNA polymerase sigma factor (sigma-70 family)